MKKLLAATIVACALAAQPAQGQAANAFIVFGGLDWAWASPCHSGAPSCGAVVVPNGLGWRYATAAEWAARPVASDFLDPLGNFTGANGRMRCASMYFASGYSHCDYFNFDPVKRDDLVSSGPGIGSASSIAETWLVRGRGAVVPEPASLALLGTGLVGLFGISRRRKVA